MSDSIKLAELLFPEITQSIEDLRKIYPPRPAGQIITRTGPSPTGFFHIGNLHNSFINERFAHINGGKFLVRIEDTDQKRLLPEAVQLIIKWINTFNFTVDEGPFGESLTDIGNYGPYIQSHRSAIYLVFIKNLVAKGLAYPCFMSETEIEEIRKNQEKNKQIPGIYGKYAINRELSMADISAKISTKMPYVIRLLSPGKIGNRVKVFDEIRGEIEMQDNYLDIVLLKSDSKLPTYHLAHIVDDYLMGTTHVIRGDEWFASLPLHLQIFKMFGFSAPKYAHVSPMLKIEGNSKRKLSKRKDPEANIEYYILQGYPIQAILDYIANILNSNYEDWRRANSGKNYLDFDFQLNKINESGALLDLTKLEAISAEYLASITIEELYTQGLTWAQIANPQLAQYMQLYPEYTKQALNIERNNPNNPKRFHILSDISRQLGFFYDELYPEIIKQKPAFPTMINKQLLNNFITEYIKKFSLELTKEKWFEQIKEISKQFGFASNNNEFKQGGYIGKIGDIAMVLRIILCGSTTTPDLYETMCVLGTERVIKRLKFFF